ncbi:hypothetical protein BTUL_0033g00360 [Botrytis tulipae]|uniref:Uncharacterized protein n=1 Tax=Botrytis tulipae TaxID=87230 RepID=A0A4Z1EXW3_9HELO|nr:hypothetical protein BTUL_0033g00360 [Botrytis tulipae]
MPLRTRYEFELCRTTCKLRAQSRSPIECIVPHLYSSILFSEHEEDLAGSRTSLASTRSRSELRSRNFMIKESVRFGSLGDSITFVAESTMYTLYLHINNILVPAVLLATLVAMDNQIKQDKPTSGNLTLPRYRNTYKSEEEIIIALDFGTTYSGVAFGFLPDENPRVFGVDKWPGRASDVLLFLKFLTKRKGSVLNQPKTPTIISYKRNGVDFAWGAQEHNEHLIHGIKLLLDPTQEMPSYISASTFRRDLERLGKPAVEVAADFIGAMYEHAMERIMASWPEDYVQDCQKKFVLSVPAVWSDRAKDLTLRVGIFRVHALAARKAGFYPVTLVKEPEAAALYALTEFKDKALSIGDAIVICDAGGGTVDLISYEIVELDPRLELKELVPGTEVLRELVGEAQFNDPENAKVLAAALRKFDASVKTKFRGNLAGDDHKFNFVDGKIKDDEKRGIKNRKWILKCNDLKLIFDPVIADIMVKVNKQVQDVIAKRISDNHPKAKTIKAIILVGGFGCSEYLKSQLDQAHPTIQVIQPYEAWSAIVKGAVLTQLPQKVSVVSTQATRHYGVTAHQAYHDIEDKGYPKFMDAYGKWRTQRRGDNLKRPQKIRFSFFRTLHNILDEDLIFKEHLDHCELESAPIRPDPTVAVNCSLQVDLRGVDPATFRKKTDILGNPCWDVHYELVVTINSAIMTFSLEYKGKNMGSVEARYY